VGSFLVPLIGSHRMLGKFPLTLSTGLLKDPLFMAVCNSALLTTKQRSVTMSNKDEYFTTMESQIKKWDAEVDKLRLRSDQMSADARAKYDEQLKAMRVQPRRRAQEIAGNTHR